MKKFNRFILLMLGLLVFFSCGQQKETKPIEKVQFVDPYIGSGGHGHVFVGANVPFGAIQLGPSNIVKGWDWCSGYHYSDSLLTRSIYPQPHPYDEISESPPGLTAPHDSTIPETMLDAFSQFREDTKSQRTICREFYHPISYNAGYLHPIGFHEVPVALRAIPQSK